MIETVGNIWDFHPEHYVVVPTNIGWTHDGYNVMGAGVAKQASYRFPKLAKIYGGFCQEHGSIAGILVLDDFHLIMFPVKPLDDEHPELSWKRPATTGMITDSAEELSKLKSLDKVALPLVGCGNGGLDESEVLPILREYLDDRFTLVRYQPRGIVRCQLGGVAR